MRVHVLLADSAQADKTGKVHALGLGWTRTAHITGPMAVIALLQFESGEDAPGQHECVLDLLEEDGQPATLQGANQEPVHLRLSTTIDFEAQPPGTTVSAPLVVNLGPGLPLKPGAAYSWRATVDGKTKPAWEARFMTVAATSEV